MLYAPGGSEGQMISNRSLSPSQSLLMGGSIEKEVGQPSIAADMQARSKGALAGRDLPIYHINKYLEPIAGVLEYVLTSGGDEILD